MGSRFDITVVANTEEEGSAYIQLAIDEIKRIEGLISSWDEHSQTSLINEKAGVEAVIVEAELFELIQRAVRLSALTDGAFDISYASMDRIWKFDGSMTNMPSDADVKASVAKVGFQNIVLDAQKHTVYLAKKGMKIGFGAIGKGYAADKAKALLMSKGVQAGIINASGDMNSWGQQPDGQEWKVAIVNPMDKHKTFALLPIKDGAVVTSGDYEKYVEFGGERYSHIIDPRTGYPSKGIVSATVFAPSAELADALATSLFVMGIEAGIDMINQLPKVDCIIVDDKGLVHQSDNILIENMNKQ
ncbi:FAD:protein FMN transferase [Carboxylicivirga sp. A043]|uniref:FAD:protein FMN transferase n=1 Tax=Carboxylicivirga litoralis TaxID=2816963 RepID=UPI0021CAF377|nr:FAD:protein FMN transferase [Carboxylicivirga sp. A043]MCU4156108.1 FAD:protein FMN transferase [Carboxylicivirga sp. A043]